MKASLNMSSKKTKSKLRRTSELDARLKNRMMPKRMRPQFLNARGLSHLTLVASKKQKLQMSLSWFTRAQTAAKTEELR